MHLFSQRFYQFYLGFLLLAGFWLLLNLFNLWPNTFSICLFKSFTGIACPGCGTTRALTYFLIGDVMNALKTNPLGLMICWILVTSFLIFLNDLFRGQEQLKLIALTCEQALKNYRFLFPILLMITANWLWSITKGI